MRKDVGLPIVFAIGPMIALGQHLPIAITNTNGKWLHGMRIDHGSILRDFRSCIRGHLSMEYGERPAMAKTGYMPDRANIYRRRRGCKHLTSLPYLGILRDLGAV